MKAGDIYNIPDAQFKDGPPKSKFLIILAFDDMKNAYTFVLTTHIDKPEHRGKNNGCQSKDHYPNYFIPVGMAWLDRDTWVQLENYQYWPLQKLLSEHFSNAGFQYKDKLNNKIIKDILRCAMQSPDSSDEDKAAFKKELNRL